jgi:hypothetical protein
MRFNFFFFFFSLSLSSFAVLAFVYSFLPSVFSDMELPSAEQLELDLQNELHALRKDPNVYATFLRGNRQNLYKGNELELLKDDLKTKVLLATKDGRKSCLAAISALVSVVLGGVVLS